MTVDGAAAMTTLTDIVAIGAAMTAHDGGCEPSRPGDVESYRDNVKLV
ncbi:hypothetical protein DSM100688_0055 [Bifidobacterium ramosum]|uniref:Uncharacterized protein n=1 Tax=Bifidobacterium ramosum TaxID=1798158 RepID=A0A6L4X480_9BIFI|nr:hypothetical protein DSM100688_0055 [Bifidobacterium ramosum]